MKCSFGFPSCFLPCTKAMAGQHLSSRFDMAQRDAVVVIDSVVRPIRIQSRFWPSHDFHGSRWLVA
jgi:hypothetical protein